MNDNVEALYALAGLWSDGARTFGNVVFTREDFDRLLFGPGMPPESIVRVTNCSFFNCSVAGEFRIAPGVELENVVFDNISSSDSMVINTQTVLKNVVVRGAPESGGLWVKPANFTDVDRKLRYQNWALEEAKGIECMLDFSEFDAEEIEVVGLPLSKLRWNRERHVPVLLEWQETESWKQMGLPATSYWSLSMKRLQTFGATAGVFALPSSRSRKLAQTKAEMAWLIEAGLLRI